MRTVPVREDVLEALVQKIARLERWRDQVTAAEYTQYKGTKAGVFTTTELPNHGDYGFQTSGGAQTNTVQMNCNGVIRYWATTAVP